MQSSACMSFKDLYITSQIVEEPPLNVQSNFSTLKYVKEIKTSLSTTSNSLKDMHGKPGHKKSLGHHNEIINEIVKTQSPTDWKELTCHKEMLSL